MFVISATFVAEPLEGPLAWLLREVGLEEEIRFAPYHQVFQQLLTPTSDAARNAGGVSVMLVRIEDFARDLADVVAAKAAVRSVSQDLAAAFEKFTGYNKSTVLLAVLPPGPRAPAELVADLLDASASLIRAVRSLPGIQVIDMSEIEQIAPAETFDAARDDLAHIPYTETYFAALALAIARRIHAVKVTASKVLVLDCDNTLWGGVVGEDGVDGIEILEAHVALQDFAIAQQGRGVLICLASKNSESDVLEVLSNRSDMRLKAAHVVAHRINWQAKPANIRSLAAELNLGRDSFVFIDDNPVECAQMRAEVPQVVTINLPPVEEIPAFLKRLWMFDKSTVTAEDAERTRMYRENSARRAMESAIQDIGEFLEALDLKIDIASPSEDEWARVEQLTQRTNQFNFTTRRRTARELKEGAAGGTHVLRVRVADRFGDYGLVGVMVAAPDGAALLVDNLLLSCRVLGRGVEHAMLRELGRLAQTLHLPEVVLPFIRTARNVPADAFAESVAGEFSAPVEGGKIYRIPAAQAAQVAHRPGHDPAEVIDARNAEERKGAGAAHALPGRSERYARIAHELVSAEAVLREMAARVPRSRPIDGAVSAPDTPIEREMLQLWEAVLKINGIGVEDDFFALGGTSLLSVELFAEIARRFHVQLRLTAILDSPTVRSLARQIAPTAAQERSGLVCLRRGGQRNLFLVHDGFGETLLYLNLAKRLPATLTVFGIEPRRLPGIPLAHATIEHMASFYVDQIRAVQPHGPYLLGGMCAGGVIAYEMAACLRSAGESVQMVTILDGATPQAAKRAGRLARARLSRLGSAVAGARGADVPRVKRLTTAVTAIARKGVNFGLYQVKSLGERISIRLRFALLKYLLDRGRAWPGWLPELSVMQIYNAAEAKYHPPTLANVPILLVRATAGEGTDTPYRDVYRDEDFGWRRVAAQLELVDVAGGHSSMLQEEAIDDLASAMLERFPSLMTPELAP